MRLLIALAALALLPACGVVPMGCGMAAPAALQSALQPSAAPSADPSPAPAPAR